MYIRERHLKLNFEIVLLGTICVVEIGFKDSRITHVNKDVYLYVYNIIYHVINYV